MVEAIDAALAQAMEHERELLAPSVRASAAQLDRLIADDFREVAASGRMFGKAEVLSRLPVETGVEFETRDMSAVRLAPSVVLVTYTAIRRAGGHDAKSRRASIWRQDVMGWQMVHHQGTPASE